MQRILKTVLTCVASLSIMVGYAQPDTVKVAKSEHKENWLYLGDRSKPQPNRYLEIEADVTVIGGGISGISAAVAAARQGADVLFVQDRPMLGGNASSEIRMTMNGAPFERETGVMEELLIDNLLHNPQHSLHVWDHILYNYVVKHPNITLMLNTSAQDVEVKKGEIKSVICYQAPTESTIKVSSPVYIDCTGDGFIGAKAGAEYRTGREGKKEFGEKFAPDEPDGWVMGETIMMITKDMGRPMPFIAPDYAIPYEGSDDKHRRIRNFKEGYWWVELGSQNDVIEDRDQNRSQLMARFYGVWDYVKNSGKYPQAENLVLDWVGSLPGKRESRRLMGDYILTDVDMLSHKHFDDAIAFGGWSLDEHCEGGMLSLDKPASYFHARFTKYYEIPYRCIYSKNIDNLFMAGRCASVSHVALSSTRIIGTCSTLGQAAGVAAAMCVEKDVNPRDIYNTSISELQERMLRQDYFIPNRPANDPDNLIKKASSFTASGTKSGDIKNLLDGISRPVTGKVTHWESKGKKAHIDVKWDKATKVSVVEFKFDTNLKRPIMMHKDPARNAKQIQTIPYELVKNFTVDAMVDGKWKQVAKVENNIRRFVSLPIDPVSTTNLRVKFTETNGEKTFKLFEMRCY